MAAKAYPHGMSGVGLQLSLDRERRKEGENVGEECIIGRLENETKHHKDSIEVLDSIYGILKTTKTDKTAQIGENSY